MPSHWPLGTVLILRRHPASMLVLRAVADVHATHQNTRLPFRRSHTTTTQPSRPSTSHPTTSSPLRSDPKPEYADAKFTLQKNATVYLGVIWGRLRKHASLLSSATNLNLADLGGQLNKVTGYERIEQLKRRVVETEAAITSKRQGSRDAKVAYEMAVARRSQSQREVNDLLQRKSTWSDSDVSLFTALVREDHLHEQEEARAKVQVAVAEAEVETAFNELMRTILNRYHEEQVWSDKIRSASTYGSLLALGVNICVFILAIIVVEPWKRRRLAQTFERRIEQLSLENREMLGKGMSDLAEHFAKQELVLAELAGVLTHGSLGNHEVNQDNEVAADPMLPIETTAKAARDRDSWISGTVGAFGGALLTIMFGYFR